MSAKVEHGQHKGASPLLLCYAMLCSCMQVDAVFQKFASKEFSDAARARGGGGGGGGSYAGGGGGVGGIGGGSVGASGARVVMTGSQVHCLTCMAPPAW